MTTPAPAPAPAAPPPSKGCGPIVVAMLSIFFLIMGLLTGAGGLYAFLALTDSGVEMLGLSQSASPKVVEKIVEVPVAGKEGKPEAYAMALPILETLSIQGELSSTAVQNQLNRERFAFQECYSKELKRAPQTRGEMSLQFTVSGSTGEVVAAVSRGNYTGSERLSRCVLDKIRGWKFDPPKTTGVVVVRFDFLFLPFRADGS